jgi:hypothetical protein
MWPGNAGHGLLFGHQRLIYELQYDVHNTCGTKDLHNFKIRETYLDKLFTTYMKYFVKMSV